MVKRATGTRSGKQAEADVRFRMRDGLGIAGGVAFLGAVLAVILLVFGLSKSLARETLPQLADYLPGGSWVAGGALGALTVVGAVGVRGSASLSAPGHANRFGRAWRHARTAICWAAAFCPFLYLLSGLPSRNCRSAGCAYVPGTGTAFLAYALTAGAAGWCLYRWTRGRAEERAAQARERARRLRKKGKGKSRAVRRR
ncbi:membrane protein [Streptomyces levis]|uniref:Membrane protein n=1 Tax=Streptomyces levis TaxID=285566 RepID=A0ABP6B7M4_9ACTN